MNLNTPIPGNYSYDRNTPHLDSYSGFLSPHPMTPGLDYGWVGLLSGNRLASPN